MRLALSRAQLALEKGEVPVGCVLVSAQGEVLCRTQNEVNSRNDLTAHAEMLAIRSVPRHALRGAKMYVTLEPCPMCASALCHAHIGKVVWAADDPKNGFSRFGNMLHPKTKTETGVMHDECLSLLTEFFKRKR